MSKPVVKKTKEETPEKRRRRNIKDVIRDEIYGAGLKSDGVAYPGSKLIIPTSEVHKIAKRIVRRVSIGPK